MINRQYHPKNIQDAIRHVLSPPKLTQQEILFRFREYDWTYSKNTLSVALSTARLPEDIHSARIILPNGFSAKAYSWIPHF